jgi:hypothetical protein
LAAKFDEWLAEVDCSDLQASLLESMAIKGRATPDLEYPCSIQATLQERAAQAAIGGIVLLEFFPMMATVLISEGNIRFVRLV